MTAPRVVVLQARAHRCDHQVVRENLQTFLAQARARTEHGLGVPRFIDEEFRAFLRCVVVNQRLRQDCLRDVLPRALRGVLLQAARRVPVVLGPARCRVCRAPGRLGF